MAELELPRSKTRRHSVPRLVVKCTTECCTIHNTRSHTYVHALRDNVMEGSQSNV